MKQRKRKAAASHPSCEHWWMRLQNGIHPKEEQCSSCHEFFPCQIQCEHLDCLFVKRKPLPEYVVHCDPEEMVAWDGYNYVEIIRFENGEPLFGLELDD